jgi:folate-binding protein YgfZ
MNTIMTGTIEQEYSVLTQGAALQPRPDGGVLALRDADRVDFLQRMTTNNIQALRDGQSCVTVLTSPTAKIVQVFTVLAQPDELLLLPARGETAALARHLRGQIFFMDKVKVADRSAEYVRLRLMGPQAGGVLAALGLDVQAAADGDWRSSGGVLAVYQPHFDLPGYEVLVEQPQAAEFLGQAAAAGAVPLTTEDAYQVRRVELGRPLPGAELTGEYNPLEAGLGWACADDKGCYTGQEIIARQVTYDKVTRYLVGIAAPELLAAGAPLAVGGREVGTVTSAAYSPGRRTPVALAVVKRPHDAAGTELQCGAQSVVVADLPFRD